MGQSLTVATVTSRAWEYTVSLASQERQGREDRWHRELPPVPDAPDAAAFQARGQEPASRPQAERLSVTRAIFRHGPKRRLLTDVFQLKLHRTPVPTACDVGMSHLWAISLASWPRSWRPARLFMNRYLARLLGEGIGQVYSVAICKRLGKSSWDARSSPRSRSPSGAAPADDAVQSSLPSNSSTAPRGPSRPAVPVMEYRQRRLEHHRKARFSSAASAWLSQLGARRRPPVEHPHRDLAQQSHARGSDTDERPSR